LTCPEGYTGHTSSNTAKEEKSLAKRSISVFIAAAVAAYTATLTPASARWLNPATAGYCVSGTCSKFGGSRAVNIKNCRPENCRDFVATNVKAAAMPKPAATRAPLCPASVLVLDLVLAASRLCGRQ
jgi:hypothetical protein